MRLAFPLLVLGLTSLAAPAQVDDRAVGSSRLIAPITMGFASCLPSRVDSFSVTIRRAPVPRIGLGYRFAGDRGAPF